MIRRLPPDLVNKKFSRQALLKAFDDWRLRSMESATKSSASRESVSNLQSIENFMREYDETDALRAAESVHGTPFNSSKQARNVSLQIARDRLENERKAQNAALVTEKRTIEQQANEAVNELGAVNWVGKLLGKVPVRLLLKLV